MKVPVLVGIIAVMVGLSQSSAPATTTEVTALRAEATAPEAAAPAPTKPVSSRFHPSRSHPSSAKPKTVLMKTGHWFVYSHGCDTVRTRRDVVIHFHGAHTTVIPRYIASGLDAVLVIINLGIGSGAYSDALPLKANVDGLLRRIETGIAEECSLEDASITRLALSSWSAGYGAVEQFLRFRPELVDAVLLADGLHVGFTDKRLRTVNVDSLGVFVEFAQKATRRERLMSITHSGIITEGYAAAAETAMAVSQAVHAPTWTVSGTKYGMQRVTAARRGNFFVEGFAGNDKPAHARHLYAIGKTSFTRLRKYWEREDHVRQTQQQHE